jgi:DNA end-binding protein Ku
LALMPRGIWTGSLSFGLVNVPVEIVTAVRDRRIKLREVHATKRVPLRRRRVCTLEDVEVPIEEIARGLDVDGQTVMLTDEELTAVQPQTTRTIEISGFAESGEIDPVFYDRSYWLVPKGTEEGPVRAYHMLVDAMSKAGRVALGALVIHSKEHPVAIRTREGRLLLSTMLFSHEIRPLEDLELPAASPDPAAVEGAVAIVQELATDFQPSRYHDRNRRRLQALIERKSKGETIEPAPAPPAPSAAPDLMGALERSLAEVRRAGLAGSRRTGPEKVPKTGPEEIRRVGTGQVRKAGYTKERVAKHAPAADKPSRERGPRPRSSRGPG